MIKAPILINSLSSTISILMLVFGCGFKLFNLDNWWFMLAWLGFYLAGMIINKINTDRMEEICTRIEMLEGVVLNHVGEMPEM